MLRTELEKSHKKMSIIEYNKKRAIFEYLQRLDKNNRRKMDASMEAAKIVFINAGSYKATIICKWAAYWLKTDHLPPVYQGKHQKTVQLIDDENIANRCKTWIRSQSSGVTSKTFKNFIENTLFVETGIIKKKSISSATATRWLNILGFFYQQHRQGIYYDGHEREDVITYRNEFLETISHYETFMVKYVGDDMKCVPPKLKDGEKEHILVTHDECIFYANDGKRGIWAPNGELPLRKKGNGRSIMVSEFLSEACGRLCLSQEDIIKHPTVPNEARVYLMPGKNQEGYWTVQHLLEQVKYKAIPIFEALFPNCIAVFAFDNSSNHSAYRSDALLANQMNHRPGGKQNKM